MDIVILLIPIAIILAGVAIWAFFWSVNSGQFDDLDSPAHRILYDDDEELIPKEARQKGGPAPTDDGEQDSR
ncbi:MAG: cbb3-type cytochrome oxidase assembly protein CcoS [Pseudomonadota bacterium]|jgi:cbb3-type cytochrome oxidase maturation protein|nr:cbb3-type cytochrome oxidase assembly protein CcoS [Pseudomonadota bacterium]